MIFKDASLIWNSFCYTENEYNEFVENLTWNNEKAILRLSVAGDYTLFINGKYAQSNQYGDFPHYKVYDELDITDFLTTGENRICILAWYFGKSGMRYNTPAPGIIFEIELDGEVVISSGTNTLSRKSRTYKNGDAKKISPQLGYSFTYDATAENDANSFTKSVVIAEKGEFFKRPTKKLILDTQKTATLINKGKTWLFDLGQEFVGLAKLKLTACGGEKINVAYGETLLDGHVKRIIGERDFSFDYIAKAGKNEYTNYMFRLAARYIEITCPDTVSIDSVSIIPQFYPVNENPIPRLFSEDKSIYEICLNTLKLCMMEHYVDCPWREQCFYAYDSRNQMLAGYIAFKDKNAEYARANLLLMSKDMREDNLLSICFPSNENLAIPCFSLFYILAVWEYIKHTADLTLGKEVFNKLESILTVFIGNAENGLVKKHPGKGYWNFYDWSEYCAPEIGTDIAEPDALINCITLIALDAYSSICDVLGKEDKFCNQKSVIRKNTFEKFYNKATGLFFISDITEQPTELLNSLAVLSGVAEGETAEYICKKLSSGELLHSSLSMKPFKYDALIKTDREKYADTVLSEIRETYKVMLDTKTVWETLEGATAFDNAGSLCHGWSAMPIYYFDLLSD